VFIPPDHELYRTRSQDVMEVLRDHVDRVEQVGLDEAYLDLSELERPKAAARRVKAAVQESTGLTCSIGIGPSKLVAKVASDAEKPDGFVVLTAQEARERFGESRPGLVPGIGPRTAERLTRRGITTLRQLREVAEADLIEEFGPRMGPYLQALANFDDQRTVETVRLVKSESRETTFDYDVSDPVALEEALAGLTVQLCERLQKQARKGRNIAIKVRLDDFSTHTRATTIPSATNDADEVLGLATELLRKFAAPRPVRLIGVKLAALEGEGAEHPVLEVADQLALPM
jgi:DNA polymerase-4